MATDEQDSVPPIPVPPVEAAPVAPTVVPPVEAAPAAPPASAPPAPAYGPPVAQQPAAPSAPPPPYSPQPTYVPQGYQPAYQPGYAPAGPAQGLAIASMICGIGGLLLAFLGLGFLPALAAVILGHIAQRKQPHARAFWITGLITGYIGVAIGLVVGLFFFAAIIIGVANTSNYNY